MARWLSYLLITLMSVGAAAFITVSAVERARFDPMGVLFKLPRITEALREV